MAQGEEKGLVFKLAGWLKGPGLVSRSPPPIYVTQLLYYGRKGRSKLSLISSPCSLFNLTFAGRPGKNPGATIAYLQLRVKKPGASHQGA